MQMIPCEVLIDQETDGKIKRVSKRCVLFGFGFRVIPEPSQTAPTTALIQIENETILREVLITALTMQKINIQEKSNLLTLSKRI